MDAPYIDGVQNPSHTALIDGKERRYDHCSKDRNAHYKERKNFIGFGRIMSFKGIIIEGEGLYYFWTNHI